ncbi:MAG TPA: SUMF1/EgtB/PvdO family nonheme iron enzyme [Polyangiaceae bacterium]|nr:SUMF1/EgtB/PvdO family nonheme iron enzyme [Polyangiaceae bacterium]
MTFRSAKRYRALQGALVATGLVMAFSAGALMGKAERAADGRSLSFVGKLSKNGQPMTDPQLVSFRFKKNGAEACSSPGVSTTPDPSGNFQVSIPLSSCPQSLFDGSAVVFDLVIGGEVAMADQPVGFVPQARYADQVGYSECPLHYERDTAEVAFTVCKRGNDTLVRVGKDAAAFWIDRYEASVWEHADGTGRIYEEGRGDYPIPPNGQVGANDNAYALSISGVPPTTWITWLQADVACRASGKRLPTSEEWGISARGTVDPGSSIGTGGTCRTDGAFRTTGQGTACTSIWGAQDMIGNLAEWVSEWHAAPALQEEAHGGSADSWGDGGAGDWTTNLSSGASLLSGFKLGLPAALMRGGYTGQETTAGIFALNLTTAPIHSWGVTGVRCVVPR